MDKPMGRKPVMEWMRKPGKLDQKEPQQALPSGLVVVDSADPSKVGEVVLVADSAGPSKACDQWKMAEGKLCTKHKLLPIDNGQRGIEDGSEIQ
ncbi:hypothetical protein Dimus_019374 [Dionaea muscipula]